MSINGVVIGIGDRAQGHTLSVVPCSFTVKPAITDGFVRCDSNDDGRVNIADCIWTIGELMRTGPVTACRDAADCDKDGSVQIGDVTYGLEYPFLGASPPSDPFPECARHAASTAESCPVGASVACP